MNTDEVDLVSCPDKKCENLLNLSLEISMPEHVWTWRCLKTPLPFIHHFPPDTPFPNASFLMHQSIWAGKPDWPIPAQSAQPCATQNLACLKTETVLIKTHGKCFSLAAFHPNFSPARVGNLRSSPANVPLRCSSKRSAFPHKQRGTPPQTKGLHICCEETAKNIRSFTLSRTAAQVWSEATSSLQLGQSEAHIRCILSCKYMRWNHGNLFSFQWALPPLPF